MRWWLLVFLIRSPRVVGVSFRRETLKNALLHYGILSLFQSPYLIQVTSLNSQIIAVLRVTSPPGG
jgi:hypothetical protein